MRQKQNRKNIESDNTDRWVVSYADFITLLFAFFATMYAISAVDAEKLNRFVSSMRAAFKTSATATEQGVIQELYIKNEPGKQLEAEIRSALNSLGSGTLVRRDSRGIIVTLGENLLFEAGSAEIKGEALKALAELAAIIKSIPNRIVIEGHTDNLPPRKGGVRSNWELSTLRAISVLRVFIEQYGLSPERFTVAGYAHYRPIRENTTPEGRAMNRRVDVVILTAREK